MRQVSTLPSGQILANTFSCEIERHGEVCTVYRSVDKSTRTVKLIVVTETADSPFDPIGPWDPSNPSRARMFASPGSDVLTNDDITIGNGDTYHCIRAQSQRSDGLDIGITLICLLEINP